jgi:predicted Zn-dependent peptidase
MRFVIAGNLPANRREAITGLLENIDLPKTGQRFALPRELPKDISKPVYVANDTVENLYFYIDTFMKRRLEDAETDALNLVNTMLTETLYSRILGTARERGLVYGMSSGLSQTRSASNWWFGAQVSDKNAQALLNIIVNEVTKVRGGDINDDELKATKQYALGRFQRSAQTVGGTAAGYAGRYFFDGIIDDYYRIPARIEAITRDRIIAVANAMFAEKIWGLGVLGNCGPDFAADLQKHLSPLW